MNTPPMQRKPLDLAAMRQRLKEPNARQYWRSLDQLAGDEELERLIQQQFPRQATLLDSVNRRDFLRLMGASLALAGLAACVPVSGAQILPYTKPPEEVVAGQLLPYASAMLQDGYARGVLITTTMGRPIKVEGLPGHPDSMGTSDIFMQASLLELYDPDRARAVTNQGTEKTWQDFVTALTPLLAGLGTGGGLRILTGPVTSPSLTDQLKALLAKYPQAKWHTYSPLGRTNTQAGAALAFGQPYEPIYDFSKADVILSLDGDFLFTDPGHLRYSRDFSQRHQPVSSNGVMSRLYVVESRQSMTGSNADHRLAVKPSQVETFARAVASQLGVAVTAPSYGVPGGYMLDPLAADLKKAGSAALVIVGESQPAVVHALAHAMNQALGSIGATVSFIPPVETNPTGADAGLPALVTDLNNGAVDLLVVMDGNPAYAGPADLDFASAMKKAKNSVYLGNSLDETAALATWFIPLTHAMEMWGDARAYDGTTSLIQPMIAPLFGGKMPSELLAALMGQGDAQGYALLQAYWKGQMNSAHFDQDWRQMVSNGLVPNTAAKPAAAPPAVNPSIFSAAPAAASTNLEIVFEPDDTVWDGRFANNAWLQELPKPLTKLTWDNAACLSPNTAIRLSLNDNDVVSIKLGGRSVDAPVLIQPGEPDDVVVVSLGYGRKAGGSVLEGTGFSVYTIRTSDAPWFAANPELTKTGKTYSLVTTRDHWTMEGRDIVRSATLTEYQAHPNFAQDTTTQPPTLYGEFPDTGYAWGMSINLNTCIGCNACVLACQAENNIPTVGKDQVSRGREMHWIRVDRYFTGAIDNPEVVYQPVPCMQCEKAPCEVVCPVQATTHSVEGLNEMTYNRCVGTRYCSNNCPYKVRRFNFYKYNDDTVLPLYGMRNPDVTVRMRGVMEKCTYCIQRINRARISAEIAGHKIADGDIKTACQQACPVNAIVFGDINNADSQVTKLKATPLNYGLLAELGTRPRTTYQAKVKNPNPLINDPAQV